MASTEDAPTPLYVLIPPSPLFAAHWSFFIPQLLPYDSVTRRHEESKSGRRIHVSGDRLNGFRLELVRDYDIGKHRSVGTRRFPIAVVPSTHLHAGADSVGRAANAGNAFTQKDEDEGGGYVDNTPVDDFERACVHVHAPGPSLTSAQSSIGPGGRRVKTEAKDCQWWIREVVKTLWERGMLEAQSKGKDGSEHKSPIELVDALPKH